MYAVVRRNHYDPARLPESAAQLQEFQTLHAEQPGYIGNLVVDIGSGRFALITLWTDEDAANAAIPNLVPHIQRLLEPIMVEPSELIGTGQVVENDLVKQ